MTSDGTHNSGHNFEEGGGGVQKGPPGCTTPSGGSAQHGWKWKVLPLAEIAAP